VETDQKSFGRTLALWMGSYFVAATLLFFYTTASLFSLLMAGLLTLVITIIRYRLLQNKFSGNHS